MPLRFVRFAVPTEERADAYLAVVRERESLIGQVEERHGRDRAAFLRLGHIAITKVASGGEQFTRGFVILDPDDGVASTLEVHMRSGNQVVPSAFRIHDKGGLEFPRRALPDGWFGLAVLYRDPSDMDAVHDEVRRRMGDKVSGSAADRRRDELYAFFGQFRGGVPGPDMPEEQRRAWQEGVDSVVVEPIPEAVVAAHLAFVELHEPPGAA